MYCECSNNKMGGYVFQLCCVYMYWCLATDCRHVSMQIGVCVGPTSGLCGNAWGTCLASKTLWRGVPLPACLLDEDFAQPRLAKGVVLQVELVKPGGHASSRERGGLGNASVEEHIRAENGSDEGGTVRLTHVRSWHMRARTREGHSEARLRHRATGRRPGGCAARGAVLPTNLWKMFLSACTSRVSTFRS